ncbi:MAG TPA: hypothetical protein VG986_10025 [Pseudolabrys sp.]|nr:hypothetical protein [Pseudolabrys sp.]
MPASDVTAILSRPFALIGLFGGLLLIAALALWAHYGTAVFFEVIRAGWVACF